MIHSRWNRVLIELTDDGMACEGIASVIARERMDMHVRHANVSDAS